MNPIVRLPGGAFGLLSGDQVIATLQIHTRTDPATLDVCLVDGGEILSPHGLAALALGAFQRGLKAERSAG